ncbi:MFS transporter [Kribbella sp. NPDC050124]|uniref:MFS transporter n=1 Tax=Kribbella sp. NPDC050124 TaxID=3364114 RepID=UPI0037B3864B
MLTSSFTVLLVTRVLAALANAGFLAIALATATSLVRPDARGRATSVLLGGTTLACIAGVPGGAVLGQHFGWRAAFWAVAIISLPALIAILRAVPAVRITSPSAPHGLRPQRHLVVLLLLGALVNGATFCPIVVTSAWCSLLRAPCWSAGPRSTASLAPTTVVLVFVQGLLSFAVGSTVISYALYAAPESPVLAGGLATASLNVGAALGPALGGAAITLTDYRAPLWLSAILVSMALILACTTRVRARRDT